MIIFIYFLQGLSHFGGKRAGEPPKIEDDEEAVPFAGYGTNQNNLFKEKRK